MSSVSSHHCSACRIFFESKSDLIRGYHGDPKSLFDTNGNMVGSMEIAGD